MIRNSLIVFIVLLTSTCFADVIFEANFDDDHSSEWTDGGQVGHNVAGTHNESDPGLGIPAPFTGYINHSANNSLEINTGYGRSNSYGCRLGMEYDGVTNQVGLTIYLPNTSGVYDYEGYTDVYIRFYFKYSQDFDWIFPGQTFAYHKWLRVWQNVPENRVKGDEPEGDEPDQDMSREENTGYVIIGLGEDQWAEFSPYFYAGVCADTEGNSSSGTYIYWHNYTYAENETFMEDMTGNIDANGEFEDTQDWHCFEARVKLSTTGESDDGVIELWFDGTKQGTMDEIQEQSNPTDTNPSNVFPLTKLGVGINYITLFDNADSWDWSEQHYMYIDDVVISTEYVGPDYVIGGQSGNTNIGTGVSGAVGVGVTVNISD